VLERETLPDPCVNLVFATGASAVHGVGTRKLVAPLEGQGAVIGTRFKAGGFFPFVRSSVTELTDRVLSLREAFGVDVASLERAVLEATDVRASLEVVAEFLRALHPERDENVTTVARVAAIAEERPSIHTVDELCEASGVQSRNLQRLFRRYVGVGPKWMIRWFRVNEAAKRAAGGTVVDWKSLSGELGYSDATQFFRDVKAQVGLQAG
jgi:AraC-like DNA-binding protein